MVWRYLTKCVSADLDKLVPIWEINTMASKPVDIGQSYKSLDYIGYFSMFHVQCFSYEANTEQMWSGCCLVFRPILWSKDWIFSPKKKSLWLQKKKKNNYKTKQTWQLVDNLFKPIQTQKCHICTFCHTQQTIPYILRWRWTSVAELICLSGHFCDCMYLACSSGRMTMTPFERKTCHRCPVTTSIALCVFYSSHFKQQCPWIPHILLGIICNVPHHHVFSKPLLMSS